MIESREQGAGLEQWQLDGNSAEHGNVEGRNLALVNVRFDSDAINALVYTRPRISIRADVVELGE